MRLWQQQLMRVFSLVVIVTVVCGTLPARPALAARPAPAIFPQPQRSIPSPQEVDPEPVMPSESEPVPDLGPIPPSLPARASIATAADPQNLVLPLTFMPNRGQANSQFRYHARGRGAGIYFAPDEIILTLPTSVETQTQTLPPQRPIQSTNGISLTMVRMHYVGGNPRAAIVTGDPLTGKANFLIGNDPAAWQTDVPIFGALTYQGVYPGIDVTYEGTEHLLKSTYQVAAGADPGRIRWRYTHARDVTVDASGNLIVTIRQRGAPGGNGPTATAIPPTTAPVGDATSDPATAAPSGDPTAAPSSDPTTVPVADPTGTPADPSPTTDPTSTSDPATGAPAASAAAPAVRATEVLTLTEQAPIAWQLINGAQVPVDVRYVVGPDQSVSFALGAYDSRQPLTIDPTIAMQRTFGGNALEQAWGGMAVDAEGNMYVAGFTTSTDFVPPGIPTYDATYNGNTDAFIAKLNPAGDLVYSTYLGGANFDAAHDIAVDHNGSVVVVGTTAAPFPLQSADDSTPVSNEAFITKFNTAGSSLVFSTYLGGDSTEEAYGVAIGPNNDVIVVGRTSSQTGFPLRNELDGSLTGSGFPSEGFVARYTATGSRVFSTFLGGDGSEEAWGVAVDADGDIYVSGRTSTATTSNGFPAPSGAAQTNYGGNFDAFITKIQGSGTTILYSTYLGGSEGEQAYDIAVDTAGSAIVVGYTLSSNFAPINAAQSTLDGGKDAFVAKLAPSGSSWAFKTYLGSDATDEAKSVAVDSLNNIVVVGYTTSPTDFPKVNDMQVFLTSGSFGFITKYTSQGGYVFSSYFGDPTGEGRAIASNP